MKPINDKERTLAYFQFLSLSILFLIVWTVAIFFDYKVKGKDYEALKEQNRILKGSMLSTDLNLQIDSLINIVKGYNKLTETDFEETRKRFYDDLESLWLANRQDTSELSQIKTGISKVFREWTYSIGSGIRELNKNNILKEKEAVIKQLEKEYNSLKLEYDYYKIAHPN